MAADPLGLGPVERSLAAAATVNPDEHAKALDAARVLRTTPAMGRSVLATNDAAIEQRRANPFTALMDANARSLKWLRDPNHAVLANDDIEGLLGLQRTLSPLRRGWWGDAAAATGDGFTGLESSYYLLGSALGSLPAEDVARSVADANRRVAASNAKRSLDARAYFDRLDRAEGFDAFTTAVSDPVNALLLMAESLGSSAPAIALGAAGGAVAGLAGAAVGAFGGSAVSEFGVEVNSLIARAGYDITDEASYLEALRNPAIMADINARATRKALGTAAFDGLSIFVGGAGVAKAVGAGKKAAALAAGKEFLVQTGGEVAGEATGRFAAEGRVDVGEALVEGVAAGPQSILEIAGGAAMRLLRERRLRAAQATSDAAAVTAAAEAWKGSKMASRDAATARSYVRDQVAEGRAAFDREAWDEYHVAQGMAPLGEAERLAGNGARVAWAESEQTGSLVIPLDRLVEGLASGTVSEDILRLAHLREGGLSVEEAEQELAEADTLDEEPPATPDAEIAAQVSRGTTLFQEERKLTEEDTALGEALAAAGEPAEGAEPTPELEAARARRVEVQTRLAEIADYRAKQEQAKEKAAASVVDSLVAAGRPREEAAVAAQVLAAGFATAAERTGIPIERVMERFAVTFRAGAPGAQAAAQATMEQAKRGAVGMSRDAAGQRTFDVSFLESADSSTFIHESGHVFLEMWGDLASDKDAPQQVRDDWTEVLAYLGVEDRAALGVEQHELWARSWEAYVRDGKAPSAGLRRAFAAFGAWLKAIYRSLTELQGVKLSPQIRAVMDRMLATDEAIAQAQYETGVPIMPAEALAEMEPAEREKYIETVRAAQDTATERLTRDVQKSVAEQQKALRGKAMDRLRVLARKELAESPAGLALATMAANPEARLSRTEIEAFYGKGSDEVAALADMGVLADGSVEERESSSPEAIAAWRDDEISMGFDADVVDAAIADAHTLGVDVTKSDDLYSLDVYITALRAARETGAGLAMDEAGKAAGFSGGDALVKALLPLGESEAIVERLARLKLKQQHPELLGTRAIRATARRATANEDRADALERQERHYRRLAEKAAAATTGEAASDAARSLEAGIRRQAFTPTETVAQIRATAAAILAPLQVRQIRPSTYLSAAGRESRMAAGRVRVGEFQQAAKATRRERLNLELFRLASKLQDRAGKDQRRALFMAGPGAQETLTKAGRGHKEQMNALLGRFQFKRISGKEADRRASIKDWAAERAAEGKKLLIPDFVLQEANRQDFRSLTADQLHELRQVLDGIYHIARTKTRLLAARRARMIDEAGSEMALQIEASRPLRALVIGSETRLQKAAALGAGYLASVSKASHTARIMDGDQDGGPVVTHLVRPVSEASVRKLDRQVTLLQEYADLFETHFDRETFKGIDKHRDFAGASLTHRNRLNILSLMGAPEGRQRLANILTKPQIAAVMASFTKADTDFVAARWAIFDRLFKEAVAQHERIAGQTPKAVAHVPLTVTTTNGRRIELEGGYHPLAYKDVRLWTSQASDLLREVVHGSAPSSMFDLGFLKERVEDYTGRPRLDDQVVVNHLLDVTHALTMREAIIDAQSLLAHEGVHGAIQDHYGKETLIGLRDWLQDVATDAGAPRGGAERVLGHMRAASVTATLAFRVVSSMKQLYGITHGLVTVGPRWVLRAARRWSSDPRAAYGSESYIDARSTMMRQRKDGAVQRELTEQLLSVPSRFRTPLRYFGFYLFSRIQRIADQIMWIAQYEKTMSEMPVGAAQTAWEREAVARADQQVRDTQSSGQVVDLSDVERSGPLWRLLTTFFTDAGTKFNLTRLSASRTKWKDPLSFARFLGDMTALYFTYAAISGLSAALLTDDDEDEIVAQVIGKALGDALNAAPIARELAGPAQGYPYRGPAGLGQISAISGAFQQIAQGEIDEKLWRSLNLAGGTLFGYPARAINDVADAIEQVMEGDLPTALVGFR